jgi:hypothetical protein
MWFRILTLLVSFNNKENRLGDNNNIIKNTIALLQVQNTIIEGIMAALAMSLCL